MKLKSMKMVAASLGVALLITPAFAQKAKHNTHKTTPGADKEDTNPPKALDQSDKQFLKDASIGNEAEIEMGQLAQQKASASEVKQFGTRMVHDHTAAEDSLKTVAAGLHVSLPTELDPKHKNAKEGIAKLTGPQFDKAYMALMVQEHTKTVQKFQKEQSSAKDASVKEFAKSTTPTLQDHLKSAKELESKLQGGQIR